MHVSICFPLAFRCRLVCHLPLSCIYIINWKSLSCIYTCQLSALPRALNTCQMVSTISVCLLPALIYDLSVSPLQLDILSVCLCLLHLNVSPVCPPVCMASSSYLSTYHVSVSICPVSRFLTSVCLSLSFLFLCHLLVSFIINLIYIIIRSPDIFLVRCIFYCWNIFLFEEVLYSSRCFQGEIIILLLLLTCSYDVDVFLWCVTFHIYCRNWAAFGKIADWKLR